MILHLRGHPAMSGDTFGCHYWGAAKHPIMHRAVPTVKKDAAQNVSGARVEPGARQAVRRPRLWARSSEVQVQTLPLPPACLSFPHFPTYMSGIRRSPTGVM